VNAARQQTTQEWWVTKRDEFDIYISQAVIAESSGGDPQAALKRLQIIQPFPIVELTTPSTELANFLVHHTPFPAKAEFDALHIAIACVAEFDFILTWNFKHIANASIRSKLEVLVQSRGFKLPIICTPEELLF
jgi:hypothetical protein